MDPFEHLTPAQRRALEHVTERARRERSRTRADLSSALAAAAVSDDVYDAALENVRNQGRVVLAFHPERTTRAGRSVAEGLLSDGVFRNQFETGLSSGGTSAYPGGERDQWERRLFGGAYHAPGVHDAERPRYGALSIVAHPDGPCPRFGSSYFVLRPEVSRRCSFTALGSQESTAPEQTGTLEVPEPWLAALARHLESVPAPLGVRGLTLHDLVTRACRGLPIDPASTDADPHGRALDSFVEAQIHGPIELRRDVEALVVDGAFHDTPVEATLRELCSRYGVPLRWHPGFTLRAEEFPETFRGFPTRPIALRVAVEGSVDAPSLGAGQNDFVRSPESWPELGSWTDALTAFRRVWHVLVLHGRPSRKWRDLPA